MKKNLLLILAFISLTGFSTSEVKTQRIEGTVINQLTVFPPKIVSTTPEDGQVIGLVGSSISFSARYIANPDISSVVILKDGRPIQDDRLANFYVEIIDNKITVFLRQLIHSDSGRYFMILTNPAGQMTIYFDVTIV